MIAAGDHAGTFWIAGHAETPDRTHGVLTIASDGTTTLKLQAELTNWLVEVAREHRDDGIVAVTSRIRREDEVQEFLIHGDLPEANEPVTLLFARSMGQGRRVGGRVPDPGWERLSCRWAVVGAHLEDPDSTFGSLRLRTSHLDAWASISAFASFMRAETQDDACPVIGHLTHDPQTVTGADGVRVGLTWELAVAGLDQSRVTATSMTFLEVNLPEAGLDWNRIQSRVLSPLVAFLSLAVGERTTVLSCEVGGPEGRWCSVLARGLLGVDTSRTRGPDKMLAPFGVLSLDGLAAVIQPDVVERMGPIPIVLAHYQDGGSAPIETEALELCTIAEGVHARLFERERRFSHSVADRARRAAVEAVESGEVSVAVREALLHLGDMTYVQRISALADEVDKIAPNLTGPSALRSTWTRAVARTRNEFAHRPLTRGFLAEDDIDRFLVVTETLRWLLKIVVLRDVALVAPEALAAQLRGHQSYNFAKDRVARALPRLQTSDPSAPQ